MEPKNPTKTETETDTDIEKKLMFATEEWRGTGEEVKEKSGTNFQLYNEYVTGMSCAA